jgi:hypothetical protein
LKYDGIKIPRVDMSLPIPKMEAKEWDKYFEAHHDLRTVGVNQHKVLRCRPLFQNWECEASILYVPEIVDRDLLIKGVFDAGIMCGLCDWRPRYGQFEHELVSDVVVSDTVKKDDVKKTKKAA